MSPSMDGTGIAGGVRRRFGGTRRIGWYRLGLGWILAQALLTLIPIAPGGWWVAALSVAGGLFVGMALTGVARLLAGPVGVALEPAVLRVGDTAIPWEAVSAWRGPLPGQGIEIDLAHDPGLPTRLRLAAVRTGRRRLTLAPGTLDAALTDVARAFREVVPDLEDRR